MFSGRRLARRPATPMGPALPQSRSTSPPVSAERLLGPHLQHLTGFQPTRLTSTPALPASTAAIVITFTAGHSLTATSSTGCRDLTPPGDHRVPRTSLPTRRTTTSTFTTATSPGSDSWPVVELVRHPPVEAHLLPTPLRAYDSRDAAGPKIQPGETRTISLTTGHTLTAPTVKVLAVPPGATAAIITLTIADTNLPGGFLTIYSAASPQPATSSINWKAAGQDVAVGTQVAVDATGSVKVTDGVGTAATHFIIDVVGYMY